MQKQGDLFTWRMLRTGENFGTALAYFREHMGNLLLPAPTVSQPLQNSQPEVPPPPAWQMRGQAFVQYACDQLFRQAGEPGLLELTRRNLLTPTLITWQIGYNPAWIKVNPESWGLPRRDARHFIWLPKGIVIPCFVEGVLWYIKVRVFGEDDLPVKKDRDRAKYMQPAGGKGALYGADRLPQRPGLLLAESELDALLAWQEGRDLLDVATLGGVGKRLSSRWLPYLIPYHKIFLAYDMDQAGVRGANLLSQMSARLVPWSPPFGDLIDYHREGGHLRGWMACMVTEMEREDLL
ncbi:MAG TPA: toprim domain-containing protein [Anaerolineales bacterium]|nr:toprim domain-containing protein [Anaerolineales bacterium]